MEVVSVLKESFKGERILKLTAEAFHCVVSSVILLFLLDSIKADASPLSGLNKGWSLIRAAVGSLSFEAPLLSEADVYGSGSGKKVFLFNLSELMFGSKTSTMCRPYK